VQHLDEEGATAVEYGLMTGLIAVVIAAAVGTFGLGVNGLFQSLISVWP
jgi:pilus assembly protein Flp/PilA